MLFAGGVRRPSLLKLGLDGRGAKLLAKVGKAALGDDKILSVLIAELEGDGPIGLHDSSTTALINHVRTLSSKALSV